MTTQTLTLADFLLARYDEEEAEQHARTALGRRVTVEMGPTYQEPVYIIGGRRYFRDEAIEAHPEEFTPNPDAHVLADLAAKRRIVELHHIDDDDFRFDGEMDLCGTCSVEGDGVRDAMDAEKPCPTLRALAAPYADRDDFREEWR